MSWFERFEQHKNRYIALLLIVYFFINSTINATSEWMEATRDSTPDIHISEPFLWEYSSALSILFLLPCLAWFWQKYPLSLTKLKQQLVLHFAAALLFSICHVSLMVGMRKLGYWSVGSYYDFGPLLREFFYEFRKDIWGYLFFYLFYKLYHFVYSRLKGEANLITAEPDKLQAGPAPEHLLVKKLDREFLVKVSNIDYMESAGNYVNLYSNGRIYPLRSTLSELIQRLEGKGFSRTHRSYAVNFTAIEQIQYLPSGDGEITLNHGKVLPLSRRYKEQFKQQLS